MSFKLLMWFIFLWRQSGDHIAVWLVKFTSKVDSWVMREKDSPQIFLHQKVPRNHSYYAKLYSAGWSRDLE
jgi:hypothetical protein